MTLIKGDHGALNVTQEARHRILAGLGWDPAGKAGLGGKVGAALERKQTHHDLDLFCFTFDSHNNFISEVSADHSMNIDPSGKIYHSGDNEEGFGEGDDEQISVELKELDPNIYHILFTVKIQTGHSFGEVAAPAMRLADGFSNDDFLKASIDDEDGQNKDIFVFAHTYRSGGEWRLHHVGEYLSTADHQSWREELSRFLTVK